MKPLVALISAVILANSGFARSPVIEPFPDAFARFESSYPQRCEVLLREVQATFKPLSRENVERNLAGLVQYVSNLKEGTVDVRRALDDKNYRLSLKEALFRLDVNIVGFRRSLDLVIIEGVAAGAFVPTENFMKKVRELWDAEYYYSGRFEDEFYPVREEPQKSEKTHAPSAKADTPAAPR